MPYKDKAQQKAAARRHYERNRQKIIDRAKEANKVYIERNREFVNEIKAKGCVDCGLDDIRVMEFDHLGDKVGNIADMVVAPVGLEKLAAEVEKCEVVCANCHRIRTYERARCTVE